MARGAYAVCCVLLMLASMPIASANTYDSNGVQASSSTLSILPASPTEGGSITGSLTLQNTNSQLAANVEYSFYANAISPSTRLLTSTVNILADDFTTVSATWDGLIEGENKLWVGIHTTTDRRKNSTIPSQYKVCRAFTSQNQQ